MKLFQRLVPWILLAIALFILPAALDDFRLNLFGRYFSLSITALDARIETWLTAQTGRHVDFEIDDAMRKLQQFGLVQARGTGFAALPPAAARRVLDAAWDGLFPYAGQPQ